MLGEDAETVEIADASGEEAITLEEAAAEETALEETAAEEIIASEEATTPEEDGDLAALLDEEPAMEEGGAQGASTYSSMDLDMEEETAEESGENTAV